jgi:hypothetical protein
MKAFPVQKLKTLIPRTPSLFVSLDSWSLYKYKYKYKSLLCTHMGASALVADLFS